MKLTKSAERHHYLKKRKGIRSALPRAGLRIEDRDPHWGHGYALRQGLPVPHGKTHYAPRNKFLRPRKTFPQKLPREGKHTYASASLPRTGEMYRNTKTKSKLLISHINITNSIIPLSVKTNSRFSAGKDQFQLYLAKLNIKNKR